MIPLLTTGIIFALTFFFSYVVLKLVGIKKFADIRCPPCLFRFPILGSLPVLPLYGELHKFFFEKSKEFGDVLAFYMCNQYAVVLNGKEAIQEALTKQSQAFSDRPVYYLNYIHNPHNKGIIMHSFDEHFKKFHRLSLNVLRTLGFGKKIMETRIKIEVDDLIERFRQKDGLAFNPDVDITSAVSNVICSIMFGRRWDLDDTACKERVDLIRTFLRQLEKPMTINFFPIVRFLPKYRQAIASQRSLHDQIRNCILNIMDEVDRDPSTDCFYSAFKKEMQTQMETGELSEQDDDQMFMTIRDLFVAGTDTTATTLQWFIIQMANNQDIQSRIRDEMDGIVGRWRHPSLDDKADLPLFEATLLEVMRYNTMVPLALPHMTNRDTVIGGMHIPRQTLVFPNIYSCHMNPRVWNRPDEFRVERFLDESRTKVINKDQIIPFSLGKRSCLGEILARQELFLFASALVHEFEILPPIGQNRIEVSEKVAVTNCPSAFEARLIRRPM